jgi:hypothetical protein
METAPGTVSPNDVIHIELPSGFRWVMNDTYGGMRWGWAGAAPAFRCWDDRIMDITLNGPNVPSISTGGRLDFISRIEADSIAPLGDVVAHIYDDCGEITPADVVVARYATYGVSMAGVNTPEVISGKYEQKLGDFYLQENLAGSLISGRDITFTLPEGVKWCTFPDCVTETGDVFLSAMSLSGDDQILQTIVNEGSLTRSKITFKNLLVDVAPDFTGPVVLKVGGTAGVSGDLILGEVKPAVTLSCANVTHIQKGMQNQVLGDVVITESSPGALGLGRLELRLPTGAEWTSEIPQVTVVGGDLRLDMNNIEKDGSLLRIPVLYSSTVASTIRISSMKATLYTTVPDGPFRLGVDGSAINETGDYELFPNYVMNKVTVAGVGSANADLTSLTVDGVPVPGFPAAAHTYNVNLPLDTANVPTVAATAADSNSILDIVQAANLSGSEAERTAEVKVTAPDGTTCRVYKVIFTLAAPGNTDLAAIKINGINLTPINPEITDYYVRLEAGTTVVPTVSAQAADAAASLEITQAASLNGTEAERTAIIKVTAPNATVKIYRVIFKVPKEYLEKWLTPGWNLLSVPLELNIINLVRFWIRPK